jgi:hypothetical protein
MKVVACRAIELTHNVVVLVLPGYIDIDVASTQAIKQPEQT